MRSRSKVWFEEAGEQVFGRGRAEILKAIVRTGSLNGAAAELGMSYRHLWSLLHTTEERLGRALLVRRRGGKDRGGTTLTPLAERLLEAYEQLDRDVVKYVDKRFGELFKKKRSKA